jgi:hypothetical protein
MLFLLINIIFSLTLYSSVLPRNNLFIEDSLTQNISNNISNILLNNNINKINIIINDKLNTGFFNANLYASLLNNNIIINDKVKDTLIINLISLKIEYDYFTEDSLIRNISCFSSINSSFNHKLNKSFNLIYKDSISYFDIKKFENINLFYTKGEIPRRDISYFETIFKPLIIASSTIISFILLFTLRS